MKKQHLLYILWAVPLLFLLIFYFYPVGKIMLVGMGRAEGGVWGTLQEAWHSTAVRKAVGFTFWQAGLSTPADLVGWVAGSVLVWAF